MHKWWQRTDGKPGMSWMGAIMATAVFAFGVVAWWYMRGDIDARGAVVCGVVGTALVAPMLRFDIRERGRRSGARNAEQIRAWRARHRR